MVCPCGVSLLESADTSRSLEIAPGVQRLPDRVALDHLHGPDAGLATLPPFDHALQRLEAVEVHDVRAAVPDHHRALDLAFNGSSMSGSRHVTGSDDPASMGNFSRFDASTIHLAFSKLNDRCLSL